MPEPVSLDKLREFRENNRPQEVAAGVPLQSGAGGGTFDGMEPRVIRLEERADRLGDDAREIKADLKLLIATVARLPTRSDLLNYLIAGLAVVVAICGIFIAGLGWLETRAARIQPPAAVTAQPIVINLTTPGGSATSYKPRG